VKWGDLDQSIKFDNSVLFTATELGHVSRDYARA